MREGEGKFFARNPRSDSPLPGPRDQPATLMMLSHRRDFWGGRKRERENISCILPRLALIISGQTKKSIFSECERMEMSNFTRAIYFICRINAITVMIRATLEREFYVLRNNLIYE